MRDPKMTKSTAPKSESNETAARDTANDITLDEFCQRKSNSDKRVEMIGAFHFDQKRQGRIKDSEAAFGSRFEAFVNKPA